MSKRRVSRSWSLLPRRSLVGGAGMHLMDRSAALKQIFPSLTALCCLSQEPVHLCQLSERPAPPGPSPKVLPSEAPRVERGAFEALCVRQQLWVVMVLALRPLGAQPWLLPPFPNPQQRAGGTGEPAQVKEQEAVSPAGRPSGSRHLHLTAVPHAPLGMEVMEEIPEGETFHFQACLEDPVKQLPVFPAPAVSEFLGVHAANSVQV